MGGRTSTRSTQRRACSAYSVAKKPNWKWNRSRELFVMNQANRIQMQTWQRQTIRAPHTRFVSFRSSTLFLLLRLRECARSQPHLSSLAAMPSIASRRFRVHETSKNNQIRRLQCIELRLAFRMHKASDQANNSTAPHGREAYRAAVRDFIVLMNF